MSLNTFMDYASYQPQIDVMQFSKTNQNTNIQNASDTSFKDLVNFYSKEDSSETVETESSKINAEKIESKTETTETFKTKKSAEKSEETESKSNEKKSEKNLTDSKSTDKNEVKNTSNVQKKAELKTFKNEKKLEKSDFVKIEELTQSDGNFVQFVKVQAPVEEKAESVKLYQTKNDSLKTDSDISIEVNINQSLVVSELNLNTEDFENQLDFSNKEFNSKNVAKLDKDGKIIVEDLRTKTVFAEVLEEVKSEKPVKSELKITSENSATITMEFAAQDVQTDILSLNNQTAASNVSNFQAMLNNQIQANIPEFVKAGNIVLKDNNQGTINLVIHPDDLGDVKIHLSLDGKTVQGNIAVATKEALQVFKDNAETLREAFIKSGFDAANFDVSYGGSGNQSFSQNEFTQNDGSQLWGRKSYSGEVIISDEMFAEFDKIDSNFESNSINIVA